MRSITLVLALFGLAGMLTAADPIIGTWRMNIAKSKISPGPAPKSVISTLTQEAEWILTRTDAIESSGQPIRRTNRYKIDAKEYPYEGAQGKGTISVSRIDERTTEAVQKFAGGHSTTTRAVISADGKTRTMTTTGRNAKGEIVNTVCSGPQKLDRWLRWTAGLHGRRIEGRAGKTAQAVYSRVQGEGSARGD